MVCWCCTCRVNFLLDAIGATAEDLLAYPEFALLSLSDVIGPRYYFLARHPGWLDAFSEPSTGSLQLRRVMQPTLHVFLDDVAQVGERVWVGGEADGWVVVAVVVVVGWGEQVLLAVVRRGGPCGMERGQCGVGGGGGGGGRARHSFTRGEAGHMP